MNQYNLISIVPTIQTAEMTIEEETRNQKRLNLITKTRKLTELLSNIYKLSSQDKQKLNKQYRQNLENLEKALLGSKLSLNRLFKIEETLNTIGKKICASNTISCSPNSHAIYHPIDLTDDDDIQIVNDSPPIQQPDSPVDDNGIRVTNHTQGNETPLHAEGNILSSSVKIQDIVNLEEVSKIINDHVSDMPDHPFVSPVPDFEESTATRIFEMAKQNTSGQSSLLDLDLTLHSSPGVPAPLNHVAERVTKLIQGLPKEDRMVVLKGGVNKVQEIFEKKNKPSSLLPSKDDDVLVSTARMVVDKVNSSPRLSEFLAEHMKTSENEIIDAESTSKDIPKIYQPVPKPEVLKKITSCQEIAVRTPQTVQKSGNFDTTLVRPNHSVSKLSTMKYPLKGTFNEHPMKKITYDAGLNIEKLPLCKTDGSVPVLDDRRLLPNKIARSAPLPIPNFEPRKHNLKSKFSQEIGVVHKVGESSKISPSLKQLKSKKQFTNENSLQTRGNAQPLSNVAIYNNVKNSDSKSTQNQIPSNGQLKTQNQFSNNLNISPQQISPSSVNRRSLNRKPPLTQPPATSLTQSKKNSNYNRSQHRRQSLEGSSKHRRQSLEGSSKNNTTTPEIYGQQNKLSTTFQSPLDNIYIAPLPVQKTGPGYGVQEFKKNFKIPRKSENNKTYDRPIVTQNISKDDIGENSKVFTAQEILSLPGISKDNALDIDATDVANVPLQGIHQRKQMEKDIDRLDLNKEISPAVSLEDIDVELPIKNNISQVENHKKFDLVNAEKLKMSISNIAPKSNCTPKIKPFRIVLEGLDTSQEERAYTKQNLNQDKLANSQTLKLDDLTKKQLEDDDSIHSGKMVQRKQLNSTEYKNDDEIQPITNSSDTNNRRQNVISKETSNLSDIETWLVTKCDDNDSVSSRSLVESENSGIEKLVITMKENNSKLMLVPNCSEKEQSLGKHATSDKIVNNSDVSDAENLHLPSMDTYQEVSTGSCGKINVASLLDSNLSKYTPKSIISRRNEEAILPATTLPQSDITPLCYYNCTCAEEILRKFEGNEIHPTISVPVPSPQIPLTLPSEDSLLCRSSEEDVEEEPEESITSDNGLSTSNQEANKKQNETKGLLDFLKSSSELDDIKEILNEVDGNNSDWCMQLLIRVSEDQLKIIKKIIHSYLPAPVKAQNKKSENEGNEVEKAVGEDVPSTAESKNLQIEDNDQKIDLHKSVKPPRKPRRKTQSRELDRLHEDIKKMKKTKNNIFDAIGVRKCRQQSNNYQDSSVRTRNSSILHFSLPNTSSSEDFGTLSDNDSIHSEKILPGHFSKSDESDEGLSYKQRRSRSRVQQIINTPVCSRKRGRPPLRPMKSRWEVNTAEPKLAVMPTKFKPGPKCMKLKRYGEKAVQNSLVKPLCIRITKVEVSKCHQLSVNADNVEVPKSHKLLNADDIEVKETKNSSKEVEESIPLDKNERNEEEKMPFNIEHQANRKKKKRKKYKRRSRKNKYEKLLKECEHAESALNYLSAEERRKSSEMVVENVIQEKKDSQDKHIYTKIANLPECNTFKGDLTSAQILSIAIERQDSKLLYKCIGPECNYAVSDSIQFANHVSFLHKDVVWNGDCSICFETVGMHSGADLIDALSHLMNEHLTMTNEEVITLVLSDDEDKSPTQSENKESQATKSDTSVNITNNEVIPIHDDEDVETLVQCSHDDHGQEETLSLSTSISDVLAKETCAEVPQPPRLRVRRLSGDLLSGTNPSKTPQDRTNDEGLGLSLVIKEVKTIREKELPAMSHLHAGTTSLDKIMTYQEPKEQERRVERVISKLLTKSAQSEISIIRLYKCGGSSWRNPETCKFSSDDSDHFLAHLYRRHMMTGNRKEKTVSKKFLKCIYCNQQNADAEKLILHIDNIHSSNPFQCAVCEYRASRPVYLSWHRNAEHRLVEDKILVTEIRDNREEVLEKSQSLQWSKPNTDIVRPFICISGCTYSTYSEQQFTNHCKTSHNAVQTWRCSLCDQIFFGLTKYIAHYKDHGISTYQCRYCLYGVPTMQAIGIHLTKLHPHLYPMALMRRPSLLNEDGKDVWDARIVDVDMDQPLSDFKLRLKVVNASSRPLLPSGLGESCPNEINKTNANNPALPMSVDEETEAAVSAITLNEKTENYCAGITSNRNEARKASCSGPGASHNSDNDLSNRLLNNGDEVDESTIAERLRQTRRTSAEIQQPVASRNRATKDYVRGLTGMAVFICGMAGCTIAVDDYKAYVEHLRICDNARNSTGFECPHCEYKVQTTKAFLNHLTLHGPARYQCTLCGFKHQHSKNVVEHMRSTAHRIHGEPDIVPINPLKNDKHKDFFIVKFDSDKIVRTKGSRTSVETKTSSISPPSSTFVSTASSGQIQQITTVNSLEEVEKHLHMQLFKEYVHCGICNYKDKVRSNLLHHMREHASCGLFNNQNLVNPVPRMGKDVTDLMFNKMSNHAGFTAKNNDQKDEQPKDEMMNISNESDETSYSTPPKIRRVEVGKLSMTESLSRNDEMKCSNEGTSTNFKCNLCRDRFESELLVKMHCETRHAISHKYKCFLCRFVTFQKSVMKGHLKTNHDGSFQTFLPIYEEITGEESDLTINQLKRKLPELNPINSNYKLPNAVGNEKASSNSMPTLLSSSSGTESNHDERNSLTTLAVARAAEMKESNDMIVEPYPDGTFRCSFCERFKTADLKEMRYHLFSEEKYDRYYCDGCGKSAVNRYDLESHILKEKSTHPRRKQDYILKIPPIPELELKVRQALMYQYQKINPANSGDDPLASVDSDVEESIRASPNLVALSTKTNQTSPTKRPRKRMNTVFCCPICNKIFSSQKGLIGHKMTHRPRNTKFSRKRAKGEAVVMGASPTKITLPLDIHDDESINQNQPDGAIKRPRISTLYSSGKPSTDPSLMVSCDNCADRSVLYKLCELSKHQRMIHQPYPCLRCDRILVGEQKLTEHVQTLYGLQQGNQPNSVCVESATKKVIFKCPSPSCSVALNGASYKNYDHIVKHSAQHPAHSEYSVLAQIDGLHPRPLTESEIAYLQAKEIPSAQSIPKAPIKRRNVAVKSTTRFATNVIEPSSKLIYLDMVPKTNISSEQSSLASIITTAGNSSMFIANIRSQDKENVVCVATTAKLPTTQTIEVIELLDDASEKIN